MKLYSKFLITMLFILLGVTQSNALVSSLCFTQSMGTYTPFTDGTTISFSSVDDSYTPVTIPFPVLYNGQTFTQAYVSSNGWVQLGTSPGSSTYYYTYISTADATMKNGACLLDGDLNGYTSGVVSYKTEGTAPGRAFVVQYAGWHVHASDGDASAVNMQVRFYESGSVQIVYGNCFTAPTNSRDVQIGLKGETNADFNGVFGSNFSSLTPMALNNQVVPFTSTSAPANGLTLTWTNVIESVFNTAKVSSMPTPIKLSEKVGQHAIAQINLTFCGPNPPTFSLNSMSFNAEGTTNLSAIDNAKLYYTSNSSTFANTNQIAGTVTNLNGVFTFTPAVPLTLTSTNNYFWLAYQVNESIILSDVLHATCTDITLRNSGGDLTSYVPSPNTAIRNLAFGMSDYCVTLSNSPYTSFLDGTPITWGSRDDDRQLINLGFPISYNGQTYTQAWLSTNGWMQFGSTDPGSNFLGDYLTNSSATSINGVAIFNGDLNGYTSGVVSYKTEGSEPNRVFIIQYYNWHSHGNDAGSILNCQLRLFEQGGIQIKFGNTNNNTSRAISIGIKGNSNTDFNGLYGTNFANLVAMTANSQTTNWFNPSNPADGLTIDWDKTLPYYYKQGVVSSFPDLIDVDACVGQQQVGKIVVDLCGVQAPPAISFSSMSFTSTGSTNLPNVINAKLYYTANLDAFSTSNQVGGTITDLNGVFTFTPTTPFRLYGRKHIFWLTYEINSNFVPTDLMVANCTNIALLADGAPQNYVPNPATATRRFKRYMMGNYTVGSVAGADFPNLTAAWNNLVTVGARGDVNFRVVSDLTETVNLTPYLTTPVGLVFNIAILPYGGDFNITAPGTTSTAVFNFLGVDKVTVGDVTGAHRFNVYNPNPATAPSSCFYVQNVGGNPSVDDAIVNCNMTTGLNSYTSSYGVYITGDQNNNLRIIGNRISKSYYGIYGSFSSSAYTKGLTISKNVFGNASPDNSIYYYGIYCYYADSVLISDNEMFNTTNSFFYGFYLNYMTRLQVIHNNIHDLISTSGIYGIYIYYCNAALVDRNTVKNLISNSVQNIYGIYFYASSTYGSNSTFSNNHIGRMLNQGTYTLFGLTLAGASSTVNFINNIKIINNTIAMDGNLLNNGSGSSVNIYIPATAYRLMTVSNNILYNSITSPNGCTNWGYYAALAGMISSADKNDFKIGGTTGFLGRNVGTDMVTIADWQAFTSNIDMTSTIVDPLFSNTDIPTLLPSSPMIGFGVSIPTITVDLGGFPRATPPSAGAYEGYSQELISPANGAVEVPVLTPPLGPTVFNWASFDGATQYRIQVSKDVNFLNFVIDQDVAGATTYSTTTLEPSTQYYWRVQGFNGTSPANYTSVVWKFGTGGPILASPQLLAPANATVSNLPVPMSWTSVFSAQHYVLQLSTDAAFATIAFEGSYTGTSVSLFDDVEAFTTYYWRVKATKPNYDSPWSTTFVFSTTNLMMSLNQPFDNPPTLDLGWTTSGALPFSLMTSGPNPPCTPHSAPGMAQWYSWVNNGTYGLLISPQINIAPVSSDFTPLSLWFYRDAYGYNTTSYALEGIQVMVNSTPTDVGATLLTTKVNNIPYTFIPRPAIVPPQPANSTGWYKYDYSLPAGVSGLNYIIIKSYSLAGENQYIDDIAYYGPVTPFTINSVSTSQLPSTRIPKGTSIHHNILSVEIAADGNHRAPIINQFTFNTNGTTNLASIKNARLFYSGTNPFFIDDPSALQIGPTIANPSGTFTIDVTGTNRVAAGTNYFWLTYEIPEEALIGAYVDAECTNVKLGGIDYAPVTPGTPDRYQVRGLDKFDVFNKFYVNTSTALPDQVSIVNSGSNYYTGLYDVAGYYVKYNDNGDFQNTISIPDLVTAGVMIRDFAYDGTFFYGAANSGYIYKFTLEPPALIETITLPTGVTARSIAFDSSANAGEGGFWVANWDTDISLISRTGTLLTTIPAANHGMTGMYGSAWDHWTPGGPYLWVFDQGSNVNNTTIKQLGNLYSDDISLRGKPTGVTHEAALDVLQGIDYALVGGFSAGGLEIRLDTLTKNYYLDGVIQFSAYKNCAFEYYIGNLNPMVAISKEVTTASEEYVLPGSENQEIIKIDIFTKGQAQPIVVDTLSMSTLGTTDIADISSVSIYYTGNSETLGLDNQFGTTVLAPSATYKVGGIQALQAGHNFFWVVYGINGEALPFNHIDAKCDSIIATRQAAPEVYIPEQNDEGYRQVIGSLSGIYSVGVGGQFTSFTRAFSAANLAGLAGNVEFQIISDITEPSVAVLNQWTESGGSDYTMRIYPIGLSRTVSSPYGILFEFVAADRVTIDGSIDGVGVTRNLSLVTNYFNADNGQVFSPIVFLRLEANGSNFNTVKNCIIKGGCNNGSQYSTGILIYPLSGGAGEESHDILIQNNSISRAALGIYLQTASSDASIYGVNILDNEIGSNSSNSYVTMNGIYIVGCGVNPDDGGNPVVIKGNKIFNIQNNVRNQDISALYTINTNFLNISNNKIYDIKNYKSANSVNYAARGLFSINGNHTSIVNNAWHGINSKGATVPYNSICGMMLISPQNNGIYFNSMNLYGTMSGTSTSNGSTCMFVAGGTNNTMKNNIFANTIPWSPSYAVYYTDPSPFVTGGLDYNDYFVLPNMTDAYVCNVMGQNKKTLLDMRNSMGLDKDTYSMSADPQFVAASNLDVVSTSPAIFNGLQIAGITTDINGLVRTSQPTIGAYEYSGTDLLATPIVLLPLNNSYAVAYNTCFFDWLPVDNATYYRLEYSTDPLFATSTIVDVVQTDYSVLLQSVSHYYFRLKALNDLAQSNWSRVYNFFTGGILDVPVLVSPANFSTGIPLSTIGDWNDVMAASAYYVEICSNPNFVGSKIDTVNESQVAFSGLKSGSLYYWRVRATNGVYTTEWSAPFRFVTVPLIICSSGPGTGQNGETGYPTIYSNYWRCDHFQMLITRQELNACGIYAGPISSISFNILNHMPVTNMLNPLLNFMFRMKHTTTTDLNAYDPSGTWVDVYPARAYTHYDGWNEHVFDTPFNWDGINNIVLDGCTDNRSVNYTRNCIISNTTTPTNSFIVRMDDNNDNCANPLGSTQTYGPTTLRPEFRLKAGGGSTTAIPVPFLDSPANLTQNAPMNPTFSWSLLAPDDATVYDYTIEITDIESLEIISENITTGTSFNLFTPLLENHDYSWRVRAYNTEGTGNWSATFTFHTIKYCSAGSSMCSPMLTQHITNVTFGAINNSSECPEIDGGYTDYLQFNSMVVGTSMPMTITVANGSPADMVGVWIDMNENGLFTDPGEYFATTTSDYVTFSTIVNVPVDAPFGQCRIRVRVTNEPLWPCGSTELGEVEDYHMWVTPILPIITLGEIPVTTFCAGDALVIPFTVTNNTLLTGNKFKAYIGESLLGTIAGTETGDYSISAVLPVNLLTGEYPLYIQSTAPVANSNMPVVTVNAKPTKFIVNGGASICEGGDPVEIGLDNSQIGINYELYRNDTLVVTLEGNDGQLTLGYFSVAGLYTVKAVNPVTSCSNWMTGSATITIIPLPTIFAYSGDSTYCANSATPGVVIGLANTQTDFTYILMQFEVALDTITGNGSSLNFDGRYTEGTYYVIAKNSQECTTIYPNRTIVMNQVPVQFELLGGGNVCPGGLLSITLAGSEQGYTYTLYRSATLVGTFTGTGTSMDLGANSVGTYTVTAINGSCSASMLNTVTITELPLPTRYAFHATNNGHYCAGSTTGVNLILDGSQVGKTYECYLNGSLVATYTGTGAPITSENVLAQGAYTIKAVDDVSLCSVMMTETVNVVMDPVLAVTGGTPNNVAVNPETAAFQWNHSVCATDYRLIISLNQDLSSPQIDITIPKTDIVFPMPVNGLSYNSTYYWAVYAINGEVVTPSDTWSFTTIDPTPTQDIVMPRGWNLISTNLYPQNTSMEAIFTGIVERLLIIKDGAGNFWMPPTTGTLTNWNELNGYQVYMNAPTTLTIRGNVVPASTPIPMATAGWYLVSYLPTSAMQAADALTSISNVLVIAKNGNGEMYWPNFGVNNLENSAGTMIPTKGYLVYVVAPGTLVYQTPQARKADFNMYDGEPVAESFKPITSRTGVSANMIFTANKLSDGIEIGVFNKRDELIGSGVVRNGRAAITLWGDNLMTKSIEGAVDGENLSIKAFDKKNNRITNVKLESVDELTTSTKTKTLNFLKNGLFVARGSALDMTSELSISNSPNPFGESTKVEFIVPESGQTTIELFTLEGIRVATIANGSFEKGIVNSIDFNSKDIASGSYQLVLRTGQHTATSMMVIVK